MSVDHLLVGEHGLIDRIPIDQAFAPVGEIESEQIEKQRLLLAVILGIAGRELPVPIDRESDRSQCGAHRLDVAVRPRRRTDVPVARRVLRRQSERVPAHRMQHHETARPLGARDQIADRVIPDVTHVDAPGRIRKHVERVIGARSRRRHVGNRETAAFRPHRLPARFDPLGVIPTLMAIALDRLRQSAVHRRSSPTRRREAREP
jgi:hypothetical protein